MARDTDTFTLIALLTDFGLSDEYVGVMKGVIYSACPSAKIIDICHAVAPQDISQAALMLQASYPYFADGTIHVVVVDPGVGTDRHILLVQAENQIFIGPDNGVLTPLLQSHNLLNCYRLIQPATPSNTFHGRDIMAPVAASIANGTSPAMLGEEIAAKDCVTLFLPRALHHDNQIRGEVVAIDHFGNLITSINAKQIETFGEEFQIIVKTAVISSISTTYGEAPIHQPIALINSRGYLEIAVNQGNAAKNLSAAIGCEVVVQKYVV